MFFIFMKSRDHTPIEAWIVIWSCLGLVILNGECRKRLGLVRRLREVRLRSSLSRGRLDPPPNMQTLSSRRSASRFVLKSSTDLLCCEVFNEPPNKLPSCLCLGLMSPLGLNAVRFNSNFTTRASFVFVGVGRPPWPPFDPG